MKMTGFFLILIKIKARVMFLNYTYSNIEATLEQFTLAARLPVSGRLNEIHGDCCFDANIAASIQARAIGPVLAAFFGNRTLDFSEWARFEPTESSDWTEFFCAIVARSSGPHGFDKARSWLIALEARQ